MWKYKLKSPPGFNASSIGRIMRHKRTIQQKAQARQETAEASKTYVTNVSVTLSQKKRQNYEMTLPRGFRVFKIHKTKQGREYWHR
jgi:iron uptake system EfeUOB component EfeO/EfeM